jgi:hypothetical protein
VVAAFEQEDLDGDVGVRQVVVEQRLDGASRQGLDGGDHVLAHRVLHETALREHLGCVAVVGQRALGLGQAVAQRHGDHIGAHRRPGSCRPATRVVMHYPYDGIGDRCRH